MTANTPDRSGQEVVSVTVRLTHLEITINPRAQTLRFVALDGVGCPIGGVEEMSLSAAIGAFRGLLAQRRKEAPNA